MTDFTCPNWCTVTQQEHREEARGWGSNAMHRGTLSGPDNEVVEMYLLTTPNGNTVSGPTIYLGGEDYSPTQALQFSRLLLVAVELTDPARHA